MIVGRPLSGPAGQGPVLVRVYQDVEKRAFLPFFQLASSRYTPATAPQIKHLTCLICVQAIHGLP